MNKALFICGENRTLKEVMQCIDKNAKGVAFLTDEHERVTGIITDGDIRRCLLDGYGLNDVVSQFMNTNFVCAYEGDDWETVIKKFNSKINIIPILNKERHIVDIVENDTTLKISLAQPQMSGNEYKYLMDAFWSTWISSTGKYITMFENNFSKYCGRKYGVATSNGTTALHLALCALGIGPGDEVIVPDITFAATINAVLYTGATPVIVDVEREGWCIDPKLIIDAITSKTKAIIPVHIYGQPCDMQQIMNIANEHNIFVIEDCAEAHGAEYDGKKVGSFGIISCFSFFGNKVITTGEGGMCVTDSRELDEKMRVLRDHGMSKKQKYYHEVVGFNYRMTNMQAAIGAAQVEHLSEILQWREELEKSYREQLLGIDFIELQSIGLKNRKKINWLFSILVKDEMRDSILSRLKENGIDARPFFTPLSEMDIYKKYANKTYDVSEELSHRGINLPTTIEVTEDMISKIKEIIMEY